jgi:RimJ/RimL family protein N-acetyltransferase
MIMGSTIRLRTARADDLDALYRFHTDLANRGIHYPRDVESEPAFRKSFDDGGWWEEDSGTLLIVEPDGTIVGEVGFFRVRAGAPWTAHELYYQLFEADRAGRGYITEAVQLFTDYLFDTRAITRIQLEIHSDNLASQRVAEKCGFTYEGTARAVFYMNGAPQDFRVYSILAGDPRARPFSKPSAGD